MSDLSRLEYPYVLPENLALSDHAMITTPCGDCCSSSRNTQHCCFACWCPCILQSMNLRNAHRVAERKKLREEKAEAVKKASWYGGEEGKKQLEQKMGEISKQLEEPIPYNDWNCCEACCFFSTLLPWIGFFTRTSINNVANQAIGITTIWEEHDHVMFPTYVLGECHSATADLLRRAMLKTCCACCDEKNESSKDAAKCLGQAAVAPTTVALCAPALLAPFFLNFLPGYFPFLPMYQFSRELDVRGLHYGSKCLCFDIPPTEPRTKIPPLWLSRKFVFLMQKRSKNPVLKAALDAKDVRETVLSMLSFATRTYFAYATSGNPKHHKEAQHWAVTVPEYPPAKPEKEEAGELPADRVQVAMMPPNLDNVEMH